MLEKYENSSDKDGLLSMLSYIRMNLFNDVQEDMLNDSKNSLLFKASLKELLDKSDFSVLDSFKSKNKSEQKIILEELRKCKDNNNQEIKGLEEHIKNLEEMFNKD